MKKFTFFRSLFKGRGRKTPPPNGTAAREILVKFKTRYPNANPTILDTRYQVLPITEYFNSIIMFDGWIRKLGVGHYAKEVRDCDDFSWLFRAFWICQASRKKRVFPYPVAYFHYTVQATGVNHAASCIITSKGFVEYDPTTRRTLSLTDKERYSVKKLIF